MGFVERVIRMYLSFTVIYYAWRARSGYPTTFGRSIATTTLASSESAATTTMTSTMTTTSILDTTSTQTTASTTTSVMSCKYFWFTLNTVEDMKYYRKNSFF